MRPVSPLKKSLPLLLCAGLVATSASAAHLPLFSTTEARRTAPLSWLNQAWKILRNIVAESGCMIDPNGVQCVANGGTGPTTQPTTMDSGCMLDPGGIGCIAANTPSQR